MKKIDITIPNHLPSYNPDMEESCGREPGKPDPSIAFSLPLYNRGLGANFFPSKHNLKEEDALEKYILQGWLPDKPFINKNMLITSFGSCFARHVITYLKKHGYMKDGSGVQPYIVAYGAEIVNTFTIAQQFEWSWNDKEFSEALWYTREKKALTYNRSVKNATAAQFNKTDVFIITLGLSEIWYNKKTNEVLWRTPIKKAFDPNKHGFRIATYQENVDNLNIIVKLIKKHRPNASIVFTLSPIPLVATFRPVSCVTANCVSKALLRGAIDEVVTNYGKENNVYYWPSYEIMKEFIENPFGEPLHPYGEAINFVMEAFAKHYLIQ